MGWVDYWEKAGLSPTPPLLQLILSRLPLHAVFGETYPQFLAFLPTILESLQTLRKSEQS